MYVEHLLPISGRTKPYPIVFLHGGAQTGTVCNLPSSTVCLHSNKTLQNWLNKPDGGKGWASWFLDRGYEVYIIDQPHCGRSAWDPKSNFPLVSFPAEYIEKRMTATAHYKLWPQAHLHTQWPGVSSLSLGQPNSDKPRPAG